MAGNKPAEAAADSSSEVQPGPGVVTLLHGSRIESVSLPAAEASPSQSFVPEAAPQPPQTIITPLPWWPFVLADVLLAVAAVLLMAFAARPLSKVVCAVAALLVLAGGVMTLLPFWLNAHSGAQPEKSKPAPFRSHLPIELS